MKLLFVLAFTLLSFFSFSQDGSLDLTFGSGGASLSQAYTNLGEESPAVVQPDGKILQLFSDWTTSHTTIVVVRHNANGGIDNTFGTGGKFVSGFTQNHGCRHMVLQADGKILISGYMDSAGTQHAMVMRMNANGTMDASFGTGGRTIIPFSPNGYTFCTGIAIQQDGKIVGSCGNTSLLSLCLFRLSADGFLDNSFDSDGKQTSNTFMPSVSDLSGGITIQPDGKILVIGSTVTNGKIVAMRFNSNGSPDAGFGNAGAFINNNTFNATGYSIALQSDGKILLGGTSSYNPPNDQVFVLIRLTSTGVPDAGFGNNGSVLTNFPAGSSGAYDVAVQNDGKILQTGIVGNSFATGSCIILRFTSTGSPDNTFGTGGKVSFTTPGMYNTEARITAQGTKLILGTQSMPTTPGTYTPTVLRINNSSGLYNPSCNLSAPVASLSGNVLTSSSASGNQWYLDGNPMPGATNQAYTATASGNYSVITTSGMCTSAFSNVINYVITSIRPVEASWGVVIGPNPVKEQLVISYHGNDRLEVEIANISGQILYREVVGSQPVNVSRWESGSYVVRIVNTRTKMELRKLVVKQ